MFFEVEMQRNVIVPADQMYTGLLLQRAIIIQLLEDIADMHASGEHGYFLAVTKLKKCDRGRVRDLTGEVVFTVVFDCLTFKPVKGEILQGVADRILKHGVMLKCGPVDKIFISQKMMKDFRFIQGENPIFINNDNLKLEKDGTIRFKVIGVRWMEIEKEFRMLGSLDGDYLGPI
ncbi:DNA-directed RNA polymerase V subunit 7-like [Nymphaea colorata]|nr:DNA-directed RNA polymerase V subunit 7-like [Nymphaea colorata]XP_031479420.1 DNA-directed RNA polymerase V subunit 7-like [Nymphaea colorata]